MRRVENVRWNANRLSRFSEIPQDELPRDSAPVIQHPDIADAPAYKVEVLQPAPKPLSTAGTPAASHAPTPASEPIAVSRILSVVEVTTIFLASLVQSASDFLGKPISGAVISVPSSFTDAAKKALGDAAEAAGITVYQFLDEAGAVGVTTTTELWSSSLLPDRTQLIIDLGASSLTLTLLYIREGLLHVVGSSHTSNTGGDKIDDALIKFFATDFTKKNKIPLKVAPATEKADRRAEAKLCLAVEHTKRTLSASPGAATCSVESLKDGYDFTSTINRLRFDMVARPVYTDVTTSISDLLSSLSVDAGLVDELVYVGGTACLPGLDEHLLVSGGFSESISTPFTLGTVVGGGVGDPTTVLARGCAVQAALIASIPEEDAQIRKAFTEDQAKLDFVGKTIALLFPDATSEENGGTLVPLILESTPVPVRRIQSFDVGLLSQGSQFAFELWEVEESIKVVQTRAATIRGDDDEDEEDEEVEEIKHKVSKKTTLLAAASGTAKLSRESKHQAGSPWTTTVQVSATIDTAGVLSVVAIEVGKGEGAVVKVTVAAKK